MITSIAERIQELLSIDTLSRRNLRAYLNEIKSDYKPYTDAGYLYREVLTSSPENDFLKYVELLYATLCSWNMNERGARLQDFQAFKSSVAKCYKVSRTLTSLTLSDFDSNVIKHVGRLFTSLNVVAAGKPPLVTNSKCLHFLLPNLLMPIDGGYTLPFFKIPRQRAKLNPLQVYISILELVHSFFLEYSSLFSMMLDEKKHANLPKLIDNLIIYSIKAHRTVKSSSSTPDRYNAAFSKENTSNRRLKLHEAIEMVLREQRKPLTVGEIAKELNTRKLYLKRDGSDITPFQVHGRTKNYERLFSRNKSYVSLK